LQRNRFKLINDFANRFVVGMKKIGDRLPHLAQKYTIVHCLLKGPPKIEAILEKHFA